MTELAKAELRQLDAKFEHEIETTEPLRCGSAVPARRT